MEPIAAVITEVITGQPAMIRGVTTITQLIGSSFRTGETLDQENVRSVTILFFAAIPMLPSREPPTRAELGPAPRCAGGSTPRSWFWKAAPSPKIQLA